MSFILSSFDKVSHFRNQGKRTRYTRDSLKLESQIKLKIKLVEKPMHGDQLQLLKLIVSIDWPTWTEKENVGNRKYLQARSSTLLKYDGALPQSTEMCNTQLALEIEKIQKKEKNVKDEKTHIYAYE